MPVNIIIIPNKLFAQLTWILYSKRFLIHDHNAVIDILTLRKQTPLHLAASAGQLEVCRLLLDLGANIDATDDQGQKPIHIASQNNYPQVVQLFLQQHPQLVLANTKVNSFHDNSISNFLTRIIKSANVFLGRKYMRSHSSNARIRNCNHRINEIR